MTAIHRGLPSILAIVSLSLAGTAGAQQPRSEILNSLEVRRLVASGEPADQLRLSAHFKALGDRYTAEASRHTSMSQSLVGNPSRNLGTGMSVHCNRLAELNAQSAAAVRELAAFHELLAGGTTAVLPRDAERFHAGAGASAPTPRDLTVLAKNASTPAEHRALEEYFLMLARRYEADARQHAAFASGLMSTRIAPAAALHQRLATLAREAAAEARANAEMHGQLAGVGQ